MNFGTYSGGNVIPLSLYTKEKKLLRVELRIRPFAKELLKSLSKNFEIGIFTASHQSYADQVIQELDPKNNLITFKFFRENCIEIEEGKFVKDLRILKGRNLNNVLLIDNCIHSFGYQLDNGIPILPFFKDKDDRE